MTTGQEGPDLTPLLYSEGNKAALSDSEKVRDLLERFHKQISEIDRFATAVLKAHFLIEEQVDLVLETLAKNPKHLGQNPRFDQKLRWIRAFGPLGDNEYWDLIRALNTLRNKVAHRFEGKERREAIANLRKEFRRVLEPGQTDNELIPYKLVLIVSMFSIAFLVNLRNRIKTEIAAPNTQT